MTVGLALSGGAARGIAHIGVLQYLEERSIPVQIVSGTSAGSIIGALYASGYSAEEINTIAQSINWRRIIRLMTKVQFPKMGLVSLDFLARLLDEHLTAKTFSQLEKPFIAVVVDLQDNELKFLSEGDLVSAILASCAIPGIFAPVERDGSLLADGGVLHNVPTRPLKDRGIHNIIAVDVNTSFRLGRSPRNIFEVIFQANSLVSRYMARDDLKLARYCIQPPLQNIGMWDLNKTKELITLGYEKAKETLDPIPLDAFEKVAIK